MVCGKQMVGAWGPAWGRGRARGAEGPGDGPDAAGLEALGILLHAHLKKVLSILDLVGGATDADDAVILSR